jgi:phosphoribosylaminoimidazole (AIR) synthetase
MPPLFHWLQDSGNLSWEDMLETFNLGIGMIAVVEDKYSNEFIAATASKVLGYINESADKIEKVIVSYK